MSNYTPAFNGEFKDGLDTGNPGKAIQGALFDAEFERIQTAVNSKADQTTVDAITSVPTAAVMPYCGDSAPTGFLLCNGQEVSESTYSTLFGVIGTAFNTGGETSGFFRVPDLGGRVIAGRESSATNLTSGFFGGDSTTIGETGGSESHTLTTSQIPTHAHLLFRDGQDNNSEVTSPNQYVANRSSSYPDDRDYTMAKASGNGEANVGASSDVGSGLAHPIVQPTIIMNFIIKT